MIRQNSCSNIARVFENSKKIKNDDDLNKRDHLNKKPLMLKNKNLKVKSLTENKVFKKSLPPSEIQNIINRMTGEDPFKKIQEFKHLAKDIMDFDDKTIEDLIKLNLLYIVKYTLGSSESSVLLRFESIRILMNIIKTSSNIHKHLVTYKIKKLIKKIHKRNLYPHIKKFLVKILILFRKYKIS